MSALNAAEKMNKKTNDSFYQSNEYKRLNEIPGIGNKIKEKLLQYYETEEMALSSLENGAAGCVPGISYKQALKFALILMENRFGVRVKDILKSDDINQIYDDLLGIIKSYLHTDYSKQKIHLYYPLPSTHISEIKKRLDYFSKALRFCKKHSTTLEQKGFNKLLRRLDNFQATESMKKITNRIFLTDDIKLMEFLNDEEITSLITCELVKPKAKEMEQIEMQFGNEQVNPEFNNPNQLYSSGYSSASTGSIPSNISLSSTFNKSLEQYSKTFHVVIYCGRNTSKLPDFPNLIILPYPRNISEKNELIVKILPEKTLQLFAKNQKLIKTMLTITVFLKSLREDQLLEDFKHIFKLDPLKKIKEAITMLTPNGTLIEGIDPELDKHREIVNRFSNEISETESIINKTIQEEIGQRSISINGQQILELFRADFSMENIKEYIPPEVDDLIRETIDAEILQLGKKLLLTHREENLLEALMPQALEYPVQLNEAGVQQLEQYLKTQMNLNEYNHLIKIALNLQKTQNFLLILHQTLLEFDFFYSIGRFSQDFRLREPEFVINNKYGFHGTEMINLHLQQEYLEKKLDNFQDNYDNNNPSHNPSNTADIEHVVSAPIPIDYGIGELMDKNNAQLALLTGSNSGGKTMCLLTSLQAILLAQMGLPTTGHLKLHPFDELYFFKKSNGQLSAGAFETTLLQFVDLSQSNKLKLVCADELESITEPRAAAKVIAGIFNLFLEHPNNLGIFVTHLVEMLMAQLPENAKIRVDGIEAVGLDENLNLIVDRNPRYNFIARSTPELILQRLAKSGSKAQRNFFKQLLQNF